MGVYGLIDSLCQVTNDLLFIVKQQAEILAQADVPEELLHNLTEKRDKEEDDLDIIEYRLRNL